MLTNLLSIVGLGLLCSGWILVQRWIAAQDPEVRGPEDSANGCGGCGSECKKHCKDD